MVGDGGGGGGARPLAAPSAVWQGGHSSISQPWPIEASPSCSRSRKADFGSCLQPKLPSLACSLFARDRGKLWRMALDSNSHPWPAASLGKSEASCCPPPACSRTGLVSRPPVACSRYAAVPLPTLQLVPGQGQSLVPLPILHLVPGLEQVFRVLA